MEIHAGDKSGLFLKFLDEQIRVVPTPTVDLKTTNEPTCTVAAIRSQLEISASIWLVVITN